MERPASVAMVRARSARASGVSRLGARRQMSRETLSASPMMRPRSQSGFECGVALSSGTAMEADSMVLAVVFVGLEVVRLPGAGDERLPPTAAT